MDNYISLVDAEVGKEYKIISILDSNIKHRLLDFGFVDTTIKIVNKSSLNGVFLVKVRDYLLAIRSNELKTVQVILCKK